MKNERPFNTRRLRWLSLLAFCVLLACGKPPTGNTSTTPPPGAALQTEMQALRSAHALSDTFADLVRKGPETVTTAIFLAMQLSQKSALVTFGTVKQSNKTGQFSYAATPKDRLILDIRGRRSIFRIDKLKGKMDGSSQDFLYNEHTLGYTLTDDGDSNLFVQSTLSKGQWSFSAKGKLDHEDWTYSVNLDGTGTLQQTVKPTGSQIVWDALLSGTVARGDLSLQLKHKRLWTLTTSFQPTQTLTSWKESWTHSMTWNKERYVWKDCRSERVFVDGKPQKPESDWKTSGTLLKNENAFGSYKLDVTGGKIRLQLVLPDKEVLEWRLWDK